MKFHNFTGAREELQLMDPCPGCGYLVDGFKIDYDYTPVWRGMETVTANAMYASGASVTFSPCGCNCSTFSLTDWQVTRYAERAQYNQGTLRVIGLVKEGRKPV